MPELKWPLQLPTAVTWKSQESYLKREESKDEMQRETDDLGESKWGYNSLTVLSNLYVWDTSMFPDIEFQ